MLQKIKVISELLIERPTSEHNIRVDDDKPRRKLSVKESDAFEKNDRKFSVKERHRYVVWPFENP